MFLVSSTRGLCSEGNDSITIRGSVKDAFTYELLQDVKVELLRADSSLVHTLATQGEWRSYGFIHNIDEVGGIQVRRNESYILRFSKSGYETKCLNWKAKAGHRENWMRMPDVLIHRQPSPSIAERTLGEAVVSATKVRMVVRGDTIEWNADAFQLQNGSMLDGLLKLLPGFSVNGGLITVNGKAVSSLLVNGEEFFKGDPRVALENLPAYMVDKVKSYHKENAFSYITKERNVDDLPLVVDVRLKKQYSIGWTANAEAGYGTRDRYMARLFGLRFTPNSRLAVFGNTNNTNDIREPGTSGEWNASSSPDGKSEVSRGGIEALVKDKKGKWKYTGNIKVSHQKDFNASAISQETFRPKDGSLFVRQSMQGHAKDMGLNSTHNLELRHNTNYVNLNLSTTYKYHRSNSENKQAEFIYSPYEAYRSASLDTLFSNVRTGGTFMFPSSSKYLNDILLNESYDNQLGESKIWTAVARMTSYFLVPHTPDYVNMEASVSAGRQTSEVFSGYLYNVPKSLVSNENRYWYLPTQDFSIHARWSSVYMARLNTVYIEASYKMSDDYSDSNSPRYRLDSLQEEMPQFGYLPSTREALLLTLDHSNSQWTRCNTMHHQLGTEFIFYFSNFERHFHLKPIVVWQHDRLNFQRGHLNLKPKRSQWMFEPEVSYRKDDFSLEYKLSHNLPDVITMQPYEDDTNPLRLISGNPNLKTAVNHRIDCQRSFMKSEVSMNGQASTYWAMTSHALAYGMTVDEQTGVRHYQPCNVDGNWLIGAAFDYGRRLDKKQRYIFHNTLRADYLNSVDFVSERSVVRNFRVNEHFKLNAQICRNLILNLDLGGKYQHAASRREGFTDINSYDLSYSMGASIRLPYNLNLQFDLNMLEREGYSDHTMNDLRFVANAQLETTILKGKCRLTLQGFDIFHGLSNVSRIVNAQGITETWQNTLPSYVMFRLAYRFDMKKKS